MEKGETALNTELHASKHSISEHLEFCQRKVRRTAVKYPWQLGFLGADSNIFPGVGPIGMTPLVPPQHDEKFVQAPKNLFETHCSSLLCKQPLISWDSKLELHREAAVLKWHKIILADPMSFQVDRSFFDSAKLGISPGRLIDDIKNVFAGKSTGTLHNRAGPMFRYMLHCSNRQLEPFPVTESIA